MTSPQPPMLDAQIQAARLRMSFGHVPTATLTAAGFAALIAILVAHIRPAGLDRTTLAWLAITLLVGFVRTGHAITYLRTRDRSSTRWRSNFLALTLAFGLCWGAAVWMLPLHESPELMTAMLGSVTGMAATGVSMLNVDRVSTRAWLVPTLLSTVIYCLWQGGAYGWFGAISVGGFMVVLWLGTERAHRRTGELLRLRFASENLADARKQALLEAEALSAAKGRFLATMSHEMRTPLHGILGLARLLHGDVAGREAHQRLLLLQGAGRHLLGVINDVLDFSRLHEGRMELHPRATNLPDLVHEVCALNNVMAHDKGIDIHVSSDLPHDHWVQVDADRLKQVLINLLGNAVKFTRQGYIHVRLHRQAAPADPDTEQISFEIEDTGVGIPPHEIERIFDAFHQVDGHNEARTPGSGLGLSIAQQICQSMGSELSCHSQVGTGTVFRFTVQLPRAQDPGPLSEAAPLRCTPELQTQPAPGIEGTVLLVEDNPVNLMIAQTELVQLGLHVLTATNGKRALECLAQHPVDLILMDYHMPEMDGLETTHHIRQGEAQQRKPRTPIVAMTASAHSDDLRRCMDAGMDDCLSKPFTPADLRRTLRQHLRRRQTPGSAVARPARAVPADAPM